MAPGLADSRRWVSLGTRWCADAIASLRDDEFAEPSALPGWTRAHLVAHLAANADAIGNLLHWAATGQRTPMYSSTEQRAADIEAGARRDPAHLREWFATSAEQLDAAMDALPPAAWDARVTTAQGRDVPASQAPWMRAREVLVHAVDLRTGRTFADMPADFLEALAADIGAKRGADTLPDVRGTLAARTAYLAGRGSAGVTAAGGGPPPTLSAWL